MADNDVLNTGESIEPVEVVHGLDVEKSLLGATLGANAAEGEQEPDEEYETIPVKELLEVKLGRQGENDTQTVVIDCSEWLQQLPGCTFMIAATRPGEREIYLPEVSVSNGVVTWPIMEQDTACAGTGRAEVRAMLNDKIKKSALFRTRIEPALEPGGSPDAPTPPNWVKLIIGSVEEAQAAAEHAEELVDEATACAINAVRFDESQGLTEAQKAIGRGNIDAVGLKQGAANAGKVLMVGADGNVTTGDPVQIDATLTESGQAADAAAVGTALAGKVAARQGAANAGKALVVGSDGSVGVGDAGIPSGVKTALLACFAKVAWSDNKGQTYYDALYAALYNTTPPTPSEDYISDGLMAHWDGINNTGSGHDSSVLEWTDLVSGRKWTPLKTGTPHSFGDKYLNFNPYGSGSNTDMRDTWICDYFGTPKTVEVVFEMTTNTAYFLGWFISADQQSSSAPGHYISYVNGKGIATKNNDANSVYPVSADAVKTVSAIFDTTNSAYINGVAANSGSVTASFQDRRGVSEDPGGAQIATNKICIGGSPYYDFSGKIYAIRMYNRVLTAAEVAHNYAIDVARFGLE